ncbi:MAG: Gfo/Idh/MocA family oxidoreductase [Planctomyces sp.]|nr:Gfo/Idh/MocA family oxidoreductase [Planctomyces sp.]
MKAVESDRRTFLSSVAAVGAGLWAAAGAKAAPNRSGRIRVGQIGVGHAHASKLSVYRNSADYEVVGVVEPDEMLRSEAETQAAFKDLRWMTQDELLNTEDLQVVLVETRVRDCLRTAEACIAAGKHIHLDKPAGASLPQFERILKSAERQGLLVQMGYMYRYNPGIVLLREFLKQGWLGDIFEVHTVMSKVVDAEARRQLAEFSGGMMFELGCHVLDLVVGVLGEPASVTAYHQHVSDQADGLADNTLAVLQYPAAIATVKSSAQEVSGGERRHFVVCGTEGTFHIQPLDQPSARIALSKPREHYHVGYQDVTFPKYTRYVDDAADMARILRGEKKTDYTYTHDLAVQRTLLKASLMPVDR